MRKFIPFTVAMTVYKNDNPSYFDRALESITDKQTLLPDEIVLVVDGPVTREIDYVLDKYKEKYKQLFKIIRLKENKGLGNALKIALANSKNEIVARMDSDDVSTTNRFEIQIKYFIENYNLDIVGGDITEFIEAENNIVSRRIVPRKNNDIYKYLKRRCPFNHGTVMYKKNAVMKAGGYLDLFWNEDYYLWIRMAEKKCVMANTGNVLVNARVGNDLYKRRGGLKYFKSEYYLQKYMLRKKIIGVSIFLSNVIKRFIIQIILPNTIRGLVFRKFARKAVVSQ